MRRSRQCTMRQQHKQLLLLVAALLAATAAAEFTPSVVLTTVKEMENNCEQMVDNALALGSKEIKFVPTVHFYGSETNINSYCFRYRPVSWRVAGRRQQVSSWARLCLWIPSRVGQLSKPSRSLQGSACMTASATPPCFPPCMHRYDWGSCEAPNKANIERFTSVLAKCIKKAVDAGKDIAILAHLDLEKVRGDRRPGRHISAQVWCTP